MEIPDQPKKRVCRYCEATISVGARVCRECQRHQNRFIEVSSELAQFATVLSSAVAVGILVVSVWQLREASSTLELAKQADSRTSLVEKEAHEVSTRLKDLATAAEKDRGQIATILLRAERLRADVGKVAASTPKVLKTGGLLDFGLIPDGGCSERPLTFVGAVPGDVPRVSWPRDLPKGLYGDAVVSEVNVVKVRLCNLSEENKSINEATIAVQIVR